MEQFTASEVRELAKHMESVGWRPGSKGDPECYDEGAARSAEILFAFADLLEAREKAEPVMIVNHVSSAEHDLPIGMKLYAHPVPSDAEKLAEALRKIAREPMKPWPDPYAHSHEAFAQAVHASWCDMNRIAREALAAHSAQARPPAASVTDAMVERALSAYYVRDIESAGFAWQDAVGDQRLAESDMRAALEAALAAQENPNGV